MFELLLVSQKEITSSQLDEIIQVKSIAWSYSYEKQLDWIYSNIKDTDIHVLLYLKKSLVAYLNLIVLEIKVDGDLIKGFGVGNVCSRAKGKGWGKELISRTNSFLIQHNTIGLLFCRDFLVSFYNLNDWKLIEKKKITLSFSNESVHTMIFNFEKDFQRLEYLGRSF